MLPTSSSLTRFAWLSIVAAVITIGLKASAYFLTGSAALAGTVSVEVDAAFDQTGKLRDGSGRQTGSRIEVYNAWCALKGEVSER